MNDRLRARLRSPATAGALVFLLCLALVPMPRSGVAGSEEAMRYILAHYAGTLAATFLGVIAAHALLGLAAGTAAGAVLRAWDVALGRRVGTGRRWLEALGVVVFVEAWALLAALARYPQLFDAWLYDRGGAPRALDLWLARHLVPDAVSLSLGAFLGLLVLGPLATRAGRDAARARARSRSGKILLAGVVVAALVALGRPAAAPATSAKPDFLLIGVDSLRPDRLDPRVAPRLARLAAESVRFDACRASLPRTYSSLTTLLTGRWPQHHGIRHMFPTRAERDGVGRALPQALREQGYATAGFTHESAGSFAELDLGFDEHDEELLGGGITNELAASLARRHLALLPFTTTELAHRLFSPLDTDWWNWDPERLVDRTIGAIERASRRGPSFVCAFFLTTHLPYAAPAPYCERFGDPGYAGDFGFDAALTPDPKTLEDTLQLRALYDGAVAATDAAVGRLLDWLDSSGRAKRTIVVLFSDHGQNLGELDRGFGHGNHLRGENAVRTVLAVRDPVHGFSPHAVPGIVRDVDLAPTLAALAGARLAGDGVDLGPLLRGEKTDLGLDAPCESEIRFAAPAADEIPIAPFPGFLTVEGNSAIVDPALRETILFAKERALRSGRWRLHYKPTTKGALWRLFDEERDPDETHDLAAAEPVVFAALREKLVAWVSQDGSVVEDGFVKPRAGFVPRGR